MNTGPQLASLLNAKFGKHRGRNTRAVKALNIHFSNLSAALNGTTRLPQKHVDALNALPDYAPPSGISQEIYEDGGVPRLVTWFTTRLTPKAAEQLEIAARFATRGHNMPDFEADEEATARFFEMVICDYVTLLAENAHTSYKNTLAAIERDKEEARQQLKLELNERRHLVADELTDNGIYEDEDPLS